MVGYHFVFRHVFPWLVLPMIQPSADIGNSLSDISAELLTAQPRVNGEANKLRYEDRAFHDWYRFVLSYPPHFVKDYLDRFGADDQQVVLDPFCGTGTTIVECKKRGVPSIGIEVNPVAYFACQVKTDWSPDPDALVEHARCIADAARARISRSSTDSHQLRRLPTEEEALLLKNSISPLPLHKSLILRDLLQDQQGTGFERHEALAFATALVSSISNLHFGPEVGVGKPKHDAPVVDSWLQQVYKQASDIRRFAQTCGGKATVHHADARTANLILAPRSVDIVLTSPPYPNEKDYTRTTRLEAVMLGLIRSKADLRALKSHQVRSNTRGVYKTDNDDSWVEGYESIQRLAESIEAKRIALGKTSGFERMYSRVTKLYFGGMARHLAELRPALRPGAKLAYVVGDQASYLRIMIRTGQILAEIAASLGYEVMGIDLFRTRLATATREQLREEVLLLRWPG